MKSKIVGIEPIALAAENYSKTTLCQVFAGDVARKLGSRISFHGAIALRPGPYRDGDPDSPSSISFLARSADPTEWAFLDMGFSGGVFWPSGHTSSHMALVSALVAYYDDVGWLPWVGYPLEALMGLAMTQPGLALPRRAGGTGFA